MKGQVSPEPFHGSSVVEAEALVASWIKANVKGEVYWRKEPQLKDITPKEVQSALTRPYP